MKRIVYISLITFLFISCNEDDNVVDGTAASFYPATIANAVEEDGVKYIISVETSGLVSGAAAVEIEVSNSEFLLTDPPLTGNTITLDFTDKNVAQIQVEVLNDAIPDDYVSVFKIVNVSGSIKDIAKNEFSLFVSDDDVSTVFSEDFEAGLGDWKVFNVDGGNSWTTSTFGGNTNVISQAFGSPAPEKEDNWLISPEIDFDEYANESLSFISKTRFNDEGNRLQAYIISGYTSGNPASAPNIIPLKPELDPHEGSGFGNFTPSGGMDVSSIQGMARIAFRFKTLNANDASGWEVDDVTIDAFDPDASGNSGGGSGGGGGGGTGGGTTIAIPFTDDFESCTTVGDFNVPTNWIEENVPGSKTDRGWGCRAFGRDGTSAPRASAFGGADGTDNAWLITNGAIDLSAVSSATLVVWVEERFSGPGTLSLKWSADYTGTGDPEAATWTEASDFAGQLPSEGEVFTEVTSDLSGAAGQQVYVAFQYNGGTSAESIAYTVDDVSITGN